MNDVKSLAMIKMEKNFIAYIEKTYPRRPYLEFSVQNPDDPWNSLIGFVRREMEELELTLRQLLADQNTVKRLGIKNDYGYVANKRIPKSIYNAMLEVADVSNALDYLFEGLLQEVRSSASAP